MSAVPTRLGERGTVYRGPGPEPRAPHRTVRDPIVWRLLLTVWLVYCVHFSTNVVRETYLAITLGEKGSVRVDEYLGLHPDLFEIPGRGSYINNNPGASMLGALPYALAHPLIDLALRLKPELARPKPAARYEDPRPNRTKFMNAARARGLDVKLGLAALSMQVGLMAPLGALAALLVFLFFRERLDAGAHGERLAAALALLYAFATPMLFRSAFLNQNALIAHFVLASYLLMVGIRPRPRDVPIAAGRLVAIGALLGLALLCDYSGAPLLLVFGLWVLAEGWRQGGFASAVRWSALYVLGALGPMTLLLGYQWAAFGNPFFPAQRYMPPTEYSVRGWFGFSVPTWELLWGNLLDPRYGILAFSPVLALALAAPFARTDDAIATRWQIGWIMALFGALYLFSSANQFANLQWNTGVRYMVPVAPVLFIAAVPVLRRLPRPVAWLAIIASLAISLAVSMTRESIPEAFRLVMANGPMLPVTTVLHKMQSGYGSLPLGGLLPTLVLVALALSLWLLWRSAAIVPTPRDGARRHHATS